MTGRSVSAVKTPMLLSDSEYRGFWISVNQGSIEVGREGETLPYFHWKDSDPLPVHYYSLSSWTNTVAKWIQNCNFDGRILNLLCLVFRISPNVLAILFKVLTHGYPLIILLQRMIPLH